MAKIFFFIYDFSSLKNLQIYRKSWSLKKAKKCIVIFKLNFVLDLNLIKYLLKIKKKKFIMAKLFFKIDFHVLKEFKNKFRNQNPEKWQKLSNNLKNDQNCQDNLKNDQICQKSKTWQNQLNFLEKWQDFLDWPTENERLIRKITIWAPVFTNLKASS